AISMRLERNQGRSTRINAVNVSGEASFQAIFDNAPIAITQLDLQGHCVSCNSAAQRIFGYSETEVGQLRAVHLLAEETDQSAFGLRLDAESVQRRHEIRLRRKGGSIFWSSVTLSLVHDGNGEARFGYAMIED